MMRRGFSLLTIVSLLLAVTVVALWVRGHHFRDKIESPGIPLPASKHGALLVWQGHTGSLIVAWGDFTHPPPDYDEAAIPAWILFTIFLVLPCIQSYRVWREARRKGPGLCPVCGYDLRASKDRCSECGTEIPTTTSATWPTAR